MPDWSATRLTKAGAFIAIALALMIGTPVCSAAVLQPAQALDRYLAATGNDPPAACGSQFAVQIDAALPALKKRGRMTALKRIVAPGHAVYRGLEFTGDKFVRDQMIARFLARDTNPPAQSGDLSVTPHNYFFEFEKVSDYNGLTAYVFLLKPRAKRSGLFRGELWLDAETAEPLRLWGDLVKSPSILVRTFRFVEDYQTTGGCAEPLRLLLILRTRIAGPAEMTVWFHPASE